MKPIISESSNKKNSFAILAVFFVITLVAYLYFLNGYRKQFLDILTKKNNNFTLSYSSISSKGLFIVSHTVNNLSVRTIRDGKEYVMKIKKVIVKNLVFTKVFKVELAENIEFIDTENVSRIMEVFNNNDISFELNWSGGLKKIDVFLGKVLFKEKAGELTFRNLSFGLLKLHTFGDVINMTLNFNSDSADFKFMDNGEEKHYEINFEMVASLLGETGTNNAIVNRRLTVEKIILNDITNNFAFNCVGEVKNNTIIRSVDTSLEFSIFNYNSLIRTINNKNGYFLVDKDILSTIVEMLSSVPANPQNTVNTKFYKLKFNNASGVVTINGIDSQSLMKKLLMPTVKQ
jgi:hypothetical protein